MIAADLSGSIIFPVGTNNSMFRYFPLDGLGEATQMGALWWDGGDYIYQQVDQAKTPPCDPVALTFWYYCYIGMVVGLPIRTHGLEPLKQW